MMTFERTPNGYWMLSVLHEDGWVRHVFETLESLEKYETKCYNFPVRFEHGQPGV